MFSLTMRLSGSASLTAVSAAVAVGLLSLAGCSRAAVSLPPPLVTALVSPSPTTTRSGGQLSSPQTSSPSPSRTQAVVRDLSAPGHAFFRGLGLTVAFDRSWTITTYEDVGGLYANVAFLSVDPVQTPCTEQEELPAQDVDFRTVVDFGGVRQGTTACAAKPLPLRQPGGILIHWYVWGSPAISVDTQPGRSTTIGGHHAHLLTTRAFGLCRQVHALHTIQAYVSQDPHLIQGLLEITACTSRPAQTAAVVAMLRSVRLPA